MCRYHMRDAVFMNNCRKIFIKFGIYVIIFGIAVLIALLPYVINNKKHVTRHQRYAMDIKYILFWKQVRRNKKNFFNKDEIYLQGQKLFIEQNCPHINCYITYNKSLLRSEKNFDAIVFNIHDIKKRRAYKMERSRHQKYIFKSFEPARDHPICNPALDNFFNWTWTYRLDSDIPHPFINIINTKNTVIGPRTGIKWSEDILNTDNKFINKIKRKTKAVAWFIPNCKLKNKHHKFTMDLTNELSRFNYSLDTFGPCGQKKCKKTDSCYKEIENNYYFQLVLEDSVTQDYVTEIVANAMLRVNVPIVLGSNFSRYFSFVPCHRKFNQVSKFT